MKMTQQEAILYATEKNARDNFLNFVKWLAREYSDPMVYYNSWRHNHIDIVKDNKDNIPDHLYVLFLALEATYELAKSTLENVVSDFDRVRSEATADLFNTLKDSGLYDEISDLELADDDGGGEADRLFTWPRVLSEDE